MDVDDWTHLDEKHLETWQQRVELVETLLDERIHVSVRSTPPTEKLPARG